MTRLRRLAILAAALLLATVPAGASSLEKQFRAWLDADLWPAAKANGVSRATFEAAFAGVSPNLDLPDLVLPGKKAPVAQHQAEFRSPAAYFNENTVRGVTAGGRARLKRHRGTLAAIEKRHGVPAGIILAIWGRESGFGRAKIPHDAFQVLATKAFLSTRKEMFRTEVLAALVLADRNQINPRSMKSSWAGALGQPQFLPSSYLKFAADGDGDGRADIWNSEPDTLASIARYLDAHGWVRGRDWGFEVTVPRDVSCALEGPDRGRRIADWAAMGIKRVGGKPFPAHELTGEGYLMMPAGRFGPAFIVTPNFYVLKQYNESDVYALFVGHAGDRIAYGDRRFAGGWTAIDRLNRADIAAMQRGLERLGHDVGGADGLAGFKTRRSIGAWQTKNGRAPTCFPDSGLVRALR
ncbi:lytic murein transglycosylase [Nitratireductor sp. StC3]|uniref:lytic murein transglycosylase n=1 Tax=Nitratireductor sp. StC3 TaxID=2126741 RepID=UPI000D0CF6B2|nr:lytic murein transglycosylase [Nitratireductor sp. StC3]PSM16808.1 lytic murein transglycosylase [Nitratireductor sp. StC3]